MYRIFCVFLLCLFAVRVESDISNCGSPAGKYESVTISDCDLSKHPSCVLKKGTNATITIVFAVENEVSAVQSVVHGIIAGVPIKFNLASPDACKNGLSCPLKKGESYTYVNTLHVEKFYPSISLKVRWELQNENETDIVCAEIPAKIQ